jgi:amidase
MGLASELVVARSIRDVMAAFDAVTGTSAAFCGDPTPVGFAKPPRVALCVPDRCDADQAEAAEAVAKALATLGAEVSEYPAPNALGARAATIARTILTASLAEWCSALAIDDEELPSIAAAIAAEGRTMPASLLFAASRDMARTGYELWHGFAAVDVILSPVLAHGPPPMGSFDMTKSTPAAHFAKMDDMAPNIALANVAGCPALAMPCGVDRRGLPIGIQLMSRTGSDNALMSLAARLSNEIPAITFPFAVAGHP